MLAGSFFFILKVKCCALLAAPTSPPHAAVPKALAPGISWCWQCVSRSRRMLGSSGMMWRAGEQRLCLDCRPRSQSKHRHPQEEQCRRNGAGQGLPHSHALPFSTWCFAAGHKLRHSWDEHLELCHIHRFGAAHEGAGSRGSSTNVGYRRWEHWIRLGVTHARAAFLPVACETCSHYLQNLKGTARAGEPGRPTKLFCGADSYLVLLRQGIVRKRARY